ncbi:MAG: hypothetical protein ACRDM1_16280 [Gaiellaceae bacterium]
MEAPFVRSHVAERTRRRTVRTQAVSLIGPATATAGLAWAILQPDRITLLHPTGQSFWWLVLEPPLLVVAVGVVFALLVAGPLIDDLESAGEARAAPR